MMVGGLRSWVLWLVEGEGIRVVLSGVTIRYMELWVLCPISIFEQSGGRVMWLYCTRKSIGMPDDAAAQVLFVGRLEM
jgi:hypothetical protein